MKKLINYLIMSLFPLLSYAWTSSNSGECYALDDLVILSDSIIYVDSTGEYEIRCDIIIRGNDSLKIYPGQKLHFFPEMPNGGYFYKIEINGYLEAIGKKGDEILFSNANYTGADAAWGGIQFYNNDKNSNSVLKYCELYCPNGSIDFDFIEIGILCHNSSPIIDYCKIAYMASGEESYFGTAIFCYGESYPVISNCEFTSFINSCAVCCGHNICDQDTINYPSPLIYNCNIGGLVTWNQCGFPEWATVVNGGFLDNCYLGNANGFVDTTLGSPVDTVGDGICNTTSTGIYQRYYKVDGVFNPRKEYINIGIENPEQEILPTTTERLVLKHNHPNPFRHSTTISYTTLKDNMVINLEIYNVKGELVDVLIKNKKHRAGEHKITWNGTGSRGNKLPTGIYFYKITADGIFKTKQAIIIN